jgi:hypothetical protein
MERHSIGRRFAVIACEERAAQAALMRSRGGRPPRCGFKVATGLPVGGVRMNPMPSGGVSSHASRAMTRQRFRRSGSTFVK